MANKRGVEYDETVKITGDRATHAYDVFVYNMVYVLHHC